MLNESEKNQMRRSLRRLRDGIPGFRTRHAQLHMIAAVANALSDQPSADDQSGRHIAVIEAGTGTGKTIGYLIPALVLANSRKKQLVISTSTIALQEQLVKKDLP